METLASSWYIWLIGMFVCYGYAMVKDMQIFVSILRDNRDTFELSIYRRIRDYGVALGLSIFFLILLIVSGITNLII